jgi:hypothetical protein
MKSMNPVHLCSPPRAAVEVQANQAMIKAVGSATAGTLTSNWRQEEVRGGMLIYEAIQDPNAKRVHGWLAEPDGSTYRSANSSASQSHPLLS